MADQHEQQTGQPVFRMQKMYIKDLSFESPHAPQVFQASQKHEPTIELDLKLIHRQDILLSLHRCIYHWLHRSPHNEFQLYYRSKFHSYKRCSCSLDRKSVV